MPQKTTRPQKGRKAVSGFATAQTAIGSPIIFIPGNVPSSKNSKVWTGKFLVSSKATQKWYKEIKDHMRLYKATFKALAERTKKPYQISFKFIRKSKHKFDYVNPLQSIQDAMVKHEWIDDDNADEILPVLLPYEYDKDNPGVYISITL